ncbi:NADPH:quinone reductase-like Zn-dependent oxidoreductase [Microbacterium sp. AK009]|uniref:NAD(P)-dependent alcohol dehydrogenase n=1 Tax=Microbacterium sp. AK009 TaxID=2723068 RepID=UPI0015CDF490|nr:NAD(P)-dependent alcohol dehydrogenase [Microbacterium sp. AK009]NYF16812.1 NADPH:quinone reductase-like Zn-dependent oxidoreductase [Microbacterium sp. AK009]
MTTHTIPRTMTAWRQHAYGPADVVRAETVPVPTPGRREVLLRVAAASLNSGDIHLMRGEPRVVRLFFGIRRPRTRGRGMDVAGTVVALGADVDGLAVGDLVVGAGSETLAEFVVMKADRLTTLPAGLDPVVAATLPVAGNTAVTILDACRVGQGSKVLLVGAGGGVGTLTAALAVERGADVWATCGSRAEQVLRDLGVAHTVDYRTHDVATLPAGAFDAVVDIAGEPPLEVLRDRLREGGTVALVGGHGHPFWGPFPRIIRALLLSRRARRFRSVTAVTKTPVTAELVRMAAAGVLRPVIERTFPLSDAGAAIAHVDAGHTVGKVVVVAD